MNVKKKQSENQSLALAVICMVQFTTPFLAAGVNIALPAIGQYYQATTFQLSLVTMLYLLGLGLMLLPSGQLADLIGRKKIYAIGITLYILSSILITFSPNIATFLGLRMIQGMSTALISTASFAILSSVIPPERRGRSMGIVIAFTYAGLSAGPLLGGTLVNYVHWKAIFYLAALMGILSLVLGKKPYRTNGGGTGNKNLIILAACFLPWPWPA